MRNMSRNQVGEESCAMYEPVSQVEKKETSVAFLHPWRGLVPPVAGLGGAWFRPVTALAQISHLPLQCDHGPQVGLDQRNDEKVKTY